MFVCAFMPTCMCSYLRAHVCVCVCVCECERGRLCLRKLLKQIHQHSKENSLLGYLWRFGHHYAVLDTILCKQIVF